MVFLAKFFGMPKRNLTVHPSRQSVISSGSNFIRVSDNHRSDFSAVVFTPLCDSAAQLKEALIPFVWING